MRIAITGGIGSGKSYICNKLREHGYQVYDCDSEAKRLMTQSPEIIASLQQLVGSDAYTPDGQLNKPVIAQFLFASKENGTKINAIVHPVVKRDFMRWAAAIEQDGTPQTSHVAIMECAILFESGFEDTVHKVVAVSADVPTRTRRAMNRDHATSQQIEARMAAQMDSSETERRADYVIDNSDGADTEAEIKRLINYIENEGQR
jgi:dephospho-CoA kinase